MLVSIIFIIIVAVVAVYFGLSYKKFNDALKDVKLNFDNMDIYLKRRWDIIPKFTEICKGYMQAEISTIDKLVSIRERNYSSLGTNSKLELNYQLSTELYTLIANSDNYQDMKISVGYQKIKSQIMDMEVDIEKFRKKYNASVRKFNEMIKTFPYNTIAEQSKIKEQKIFTIDETKRNSIGISI